MARDLPLPRLTAAANIDDGLEECDQHEGVDWEEQLLGLRAAGAGVNARTKRSRQVRGAAGGA